MNERKWNAISEADRAAISKISGEHIARMFGEKWNEGEQKAIVALTDAGLKTYHLEGEELAKLKKELEFLETEWIKAADKKKVDGKAALEYYRAQIEELSKK